MGRDPRARVAVEVIASVELLQDLRRIVPLDKAVDLRVRLAEDHKAVEIGLEAPVVVIATAGAIPMSCIV